MDARKTKADNILMRNRAVEAFNRKSYEHELSGIKKTLRQYNHTSYQLCIKKKRGRIRKTLKRIHVIFLSK